MTVRPELRVATASDAKRPSRRFIALTRNPALALNPPTRFEPTVKREGDIVL